MRDAIDSDDTSPFSRWLTDMSRALGYTREADLARALKLSQSTLLRWRKGSRPSVEHLVRVSRLMKTELEPLLVLSGHIDADVELDVLSSPPRPPQLRTETVRRIEEADLPEEMKSILRDYWDLRLQEERARVYRFIDQFSTPLEPSVDEMKDWLAKAYETDLPQHVTGAFMDLLGLSVEQEAYPSPERRQLLRLVWGLYERSMTPQEIGELVGASADVVYTMIHEAQALPEFRRR